VFYATYIARYIPYPTLPAAFQHSPNPMPSSTRAQLTYRAPQTQ
jgi:hypothetical protein